MFTEFSEEANEELERKNEEEEHSKNSFSKSKKYENRKDSRACSFPITLNKIEEVDETRSKSSEAKDEEPEAATDENGNFNLRKDETDIQKSTERKFQIEREKGKQRPKSASSASKNMSAKPKLRKRPKSSCSLFREEPPLPQIHGFLPSLKTRSKLFDVRCFDSHCPYWHDQDDFDSLPGLEDANDCSRSSSLCGIRTNSWPHRNTFPGGHSDWYNSTAHYRVRKCRSNPNFSKHDGGGGGGQKRQKIFHSEKDFNKFKRSLKLLGFEPSDFGIYVRSSGSGTRWKARDISSTFSTKILGRSISLDYLREEVRDAWLDDRLDISHRRLLAQAAYEEWYFKKEEEFWKRRTEEKTKRLMTRENLEKDLEKKKDKAEEEFRKWLQKKQSKRKEKKEKTRLEKSFTRLVKTKEESQVAFLKWKSSKDKEIKKRNKERKVEEEKKSESEKQKLEKKAAAEKAFEHWKAKMEENQKLEMQKRLKNQKKQEELAKRLKKEEGSKLTFHDWKMMKDEEIKQRITSLREASKMARETRRAQMEERMYEAEQAFEDWLDKVFLRKRFKNVVAYQNNIPWLPA